MLIAAESWLIMCQSETHNDRMILTGWWGFHVPAFTHCLCSVAPPSVLYCFLIIQNFKLHLFTSSVCMGRVSCFCVRSHCLAGEHAIAYSPCGSGEQPWLWWVKQLRTFVFKPSLANTGSRCSFSFSCSYSLRICSSTVWFSAAFFWLLNMLSLSCFLFFIFFFFNLKTDLVTLSWCRSWWGRHHICITKGTLAFACDVICGAFWASSFQLSFLPPLPSFPVVYVQINYTVESECLGCTFKTFSVPWWFWRAWQLLSQILSHGVCSFTILRVECCFILNLQVDLIEISLSLGEMVGPRLWKSLQELY